MDVPIMDEPPKRRTWIHFAGGFLLVLYLGLCIVAMIFYHRQSKVGDSTPPTLTATVVSTPQILIYQPDEKQRVKYEDFSSNQLEWGVYRSYGKLEVTSGKLVLQSTRQGKIAIGIGPDLFTPQTNTYCLQAEFTTDTETSQTFGLIFGLNRSGGTLYLFDVWPEREMVGLKAFNNGEWHELVPYTKSRLNHYPQANILGVHVGKGNIELYINGRLAANYSGIYHFQSKDIGLFVGGADYRLVVDNFFVYPCE